MKYYDYRDFPKFYNNAFIKEISKNPKWTISDKDKKPVSIYDLRNKLIFGREFDNINGASSYKKEDMTNLPDLLKLVPNASNHAYYLDCKKDGWVVLDIEKTCPEKYKKQFLKLPYLYGEHSLSGKGIHLFCPLPSNWDKYKAYHNKPKLQETHGWYEILMTHWVTFTRNELEQTESKGDGKHDLSKVFAKLAHMTQAHAKAKVEVTTDKPKIPNEKAILAKMKDFKYNKTVEDFPFEGRKGNYSAYEFGMASYFYHELRYLLKSDQNFKKTDYNDTQIAWLIYKLLKKNLKHRAKHDEYRDHMPWLLFNAVLAIGTTKETERDEMRKAKIKNAEQNRILEQRMKQALQERKEKANG